MDHQMMDNDERINVLEAVCKKLQDRLDKLERAARSSTSGGGNAPNIGELPKWAMQWLSHFDGRGIPRARSANATECRKIGGGGKGDWAGDPIVRRDPPRWKGKSYSGLPMSLTEPEFLIMYADFEEWKGSKTLEDADQEKRKYITYNLRNAALAKGWAEILRDPAHTPGASIGDNDDFNDANEDIPF